MQVTAALLTEAPGKWELHSIELDSPRDHEVLVRLAATGLCHSDEHYATGDVPVGSLPFCGGHEGAGVVESVGPSVTDLEVGDHVVMSFIPGCGRCRWCASGMQNLCDFGAGLLTGLQLDGTHRMHLNGVGVGQMCMLGSFADHTVVPEWSCVKIDKEIPLGIAALLGCGVPTGWGSAVNGAQAAPGDVIIIMGVGGVGINAVQGASHAGATQIIAVDPVEMKQKAALRFGATDAVSSIDEAAELAKATTNGQGADATIVTVGVMKPEDAGAAFSSVRKGGTVVLTSSGNFMESHLPANFLELVMFQKRIQGCLYGMMSPSKDVPRLLGLWRSGQLKLEELVTTTYTHAEINQGFDDMNAGTNLRGVIEYAG